jgi:hypothetical protein
MLSFEESTKLLNKYGHNYTDEEIKLIREFIAILLDIEYNLFLRKQEEEFQNKSTLKVIHLNTKNNEEKSNTIHPGEYRRAS